THGWKGGKGARGKEKEDLITTPTGMEKRQEVQGQKDRLYHELHTKEIFCCVKRKRAHMPTS
ncbi:hypothetical protein RUM43_009501, partial [Polyplax serrata]